MFIIKRSYFVLAALTVNINFLRLIIEAKIFLLGKVQLAGLIYDLIINKCHFLGLFTQMSLNFK